MGVVFFRSFFFVSLSSGNSLGWRVGRSSVCFLTVLTVNSLGSSMSQFVDSVSSLVSDALEATVCGSGGHLRLLAGENVIVRPLGDEERVVCMSLGGSGHEPAHVGYVGPGMLDAVVCGQVFASPSIHQIEATLEMLRGASGRPVLIVCKNYTGDRLNAGVAVERARARGMHVAMVIVSDDIAIADAKQPRGLCGVLFVHKIAGHLARKGLGLEDIRAKCQHAADELIFTLGASLGGCDMPGGPKSSSTNESASLVQIGLGIHGEKGSDSIQLTSTSDLVNLMAERLLKASGAQSNDDQFAVIVNNLGGCNGLEMGYITKELLSSAALGGRIRYIMSGGVYLSALNMHGFSISIVRLASDDIREALLSPVGDPCVWPGLREVFGRDYVLASERHARSGTATNEQAKRASDEGQSSKAACNLIRHCCSLLLSRSSDLNELDSAVGDGDTGSTLALGAERVLASLDEDRSVADTILHLGRACETIGGSSGVVLSILFTAASSALADGASLKDAFLKGAERVSYYGGAQLGDRTLLDALIPALQELPAVGKAGIAARNGANETAKMERAGAGRSAYLSKADLDGHPDPGACAVALVMEELARQIN